MSSRAIRILSLLLTATVDAAGADPRFRALEVPGFLPAVVVEPEGTSPRPLIVAAHGAGGSPEWDCEYWRRLSRGQAFVLCLRGTRMGPGAFYFKHHHALGAELTAALKAAREKYPRIAKSGGIYAGFSQGASMGSLITPQHAQELPFVVLTEGFERWDRRLGLAFVKSGGERVLFACGTRACAEKARASVQALRRVGVASELCYAAGAGHTPLGEVMSLVEQRLPWLVAGERLWDSP